MGPYRTAALTALFLAAGSAAGQEAGWHYSPLPGEGDRASMGCARDATPADFACLVVRCEDDFSTGVHIHSSRPDGMVGPWEMTLDRETRTLLAEPAPPYGARFADDDGWLFDGLRHGTFVYLRHTDDPEAGFAYIDLSGSFAAITEALHWCAPRLPRTEPKTLPDVGPDRQAGEPQ